MKSLLIALLFLMISNRLYSQDNILIRHIDSLVSYPGAILVNWFVEDGTIQNKDKKKIGGSATNVDFYAADTAIYCVKVYSGFKKKSKYKNFTESYYYKSDSLIFASVTLMEGKNRDKLIYQVSAYYCKGELINLIVKGKPDFSVDKLWESGIDNLKRYLQFGRGHA